MKRRWLATLIAGFLSAVILAWIIVPATIIPPAAPANPVIVHVAGSGLHARLVMPLGDRWVQYEFGDWNYYARREQTLINGLLALLWPTPGALGRGEVDSVDRFRADSEAQGGQFLSFEVSGARVNQLQHSLYTRFEQQIPQGQVYNRVNNLILVRDNQSYSVLHNSNHELAEWLEVLDCQVESLGFWTDFRLTKTDE